MSIQSNLEIKQAVISEEPDLHEHAGHYTYTIRSSDTDYTDRIHFHSLFALMQEAAAANVWDYGWGADTMDQLGSCWLLLRISLRLQKRPAWLEKITIETWSRGCDRLYFFRDFILHDQNKQVIGQGTSVWIAADKVTHRPLRPSEIMNYATSSSDPRKALPFDPPKIKPQGSLETLLQASPEFTLTRYADFSEIDRNLHVNNTRYVAWCLDAAYKKGLNQEQIIGIDICYASEIIFSEKVQIVFQEQEDGRVLVDGIVIDSQKIAFSAILYRED